MFLSAGFSTSQWVQLPALSLCAKTLKVFHSGGSVLRATQKRTELLLLAKMSSTLHFSHSRLFKRNLKNGIRRTAVPRRAAIPEERSDWFSCGRISQWSAALHQLCQSDQGDLHSHSNTRLLKQLIFLHGANMGSDYVF